MTDSPLLYSRQEAAELLRISTITLDRLRRTGTGPACVSLGRRVLYSRDMLENWVREREGRVEQ